MSVAGYFGKGKRELRMPKGVDKLGVRFEGAVLTGELSVEERLKTEAVDCYERVEDYDPVLRAHLGSR